MVLGNTLDIFLKVNVDIKELAALRVAQRRISKFSGRAQAKIGGLTGSFAVLAQRFRQSEMGASQLARQMQMLNMRFLGLMFTGLNLAFIFGMLLSLAPGVGAGASAIANALKVALIPAGQKLLPVMLNVAKSIRNMDEDQKDLLSTIAIVGTILGVVIGLFGLLAMAILNIGSLIVSTVGVIGTIITAFQAWSATGSILMLSFKGIMAVVAGLAGAFVTAFGIASAAFVFFGDKVGTIVSAILIAIGAVLAVFGFLPLGIAVAVGAAAALIWNFKDEIISALTGAIDFVKSVFVSSLKKQFNALNRFVKGFTQIFKGIGQMLGGNFTEGLETAIKGAKNAIMGAINYLLPFDLTISDIAGVVGDIGGAIENVGDFVITDDGRVLKPSAQDTIIGTKNPEALGGGGGGGQVNVTVNNPELNNDVDVESLIDEIERRVDQDARGRSLI